MKKSMVFEGVTVTLIILLAFLTLAMVMGGNAVKEVPGVGEFQYTFVDDESTLYVFAGNNISAIDVCGTQKWTFRVPEEWGVCSYGYFPGALRTDGKPWMYEGSPIVSASNGILYVYLRPLAKNLSDYSMDGVLMAVSNGRELWRLPLTGHSFGYPAWGPGNSYDDSRRFSDTMVYARGDKVYAFHAYNETVIGENGTVLWSVGSVAAPAAVDGNGFVYTLYALAPAENLQYPYNVYVPDYREPSNVIDAYYPNGTLYWKYSTKYPLAAQYDPREVEYSIATLPLYYNGMVYAPMYDGVTALYANGTAGWTKTYEWDDFKFDWPFDVDNLTESEKSNIIAFERMYTNYNILPVMERNGIIIRLSLYNPTPFDPAGNVYLQCTSDIPPQGGVSGLYRMYLITIGPDGRELSRNYIYNQLYVTARDGVGYATETTLSLNESSQYVYTGYNARSVTDLASERLVAIDMNDNTELWNHTFSVSTPVAVTLDVNNVRTLIGGYYAEEAINYSRNGVSDACRSSWGPITSSDSLRVFPSNNTTYVSFQSLNYESPIVLGKSKCAYGGGIYAFDKNGSLLWHKPMLPFDPVQVTQNGTVFYRTPDGRIGVTGAGIAAGFTLTALLYLFLRFLLVGAVARARARLDKNDNRNRILDYIVKNPGSSLYEVTRGTGVNLGTVRYHLFILSLNHKVVASQTDGKYVRFFTNSGTYSREQQLIFSLMRRDAMGRILSLMLERPGISNAEIARTLGIKESVASRCTRELSERGIVTRNAGRGCSVEEAHRPHVLAAMRRIYGE